MSIRSRFSAHLMLCRSREIRGAYDLSIARSIWLGATAIVLRLRLAALSGWSVSWGSDESSPPASSLPRAVEASRPLH